MKKIITNGVLVISILVFIYSAVQLLGIFQEYRKGEEEYDTIQKETVIVKPAPSDAGEEADTYLEIDFKKLQQTNRDFVGWIYFEEPSGISYPIVAGIDNQKYLNTTFDGKQNSAGTLFIDMDNANDFSDKNTFIYGHNMKNGTMFGKLKKYKSENFCKEHPYFQIYTPDGKVATYEIFAVSVVEATSKSYTKVYADDDAYLKYLDYTKSVSRYTSEVELSAESQIVSLSTCTNVNDEERLLVQAVKIHEEMIGE